MNKTSPYITEGIAIVVLAVIVIYFFISWFI